VTHTLKHAMMGEARCRPHKHTRTLNSHFAVVSSCHAGTRDGDSVASPHPKPYTGSGPNHQAPVHMACAAKSALFPSHACTGCSSAPK